MELYIHIPFCVKKCAYCDFVSGVSTCDEREQYVNQLCQELEMCRKYAQGKVLNTIFLGGGTPSILEAAQIEKILRRVRRYYHVAADAEITLEANPGTLTKEKLRGYRRAGVNRLSLGLQSVHDEELKLLGRIHTFEEFCESYQMAREAGFDNMNVDLMSAIPGQTQASWRKTLETVIGFEPEHISAYSLIIEPGTPFYEWYGEKAKCAERCLPSETDEREMYYLTKEILHHAGYERYEISNYSKPGRECRHNLGYWERETYLGVGASAASFLENEQGRWRYTNPTDLREWRLQRGQKFDGEYLNVKDEMAEYMFLGLRKMAGISAQDFQQNFGVALADVYGDQLKKLLKLKLLDCEKNHFFLTNRGIDVSNMVFVEFI